jgi:hypothetical protein
MVIEITLMPESIRPRRGRTIPCRNGAINIRSLRDQTLLIWSTLIRDQETDIEEVTCL